MISHVKLTFSGRQYASVAVLAFLLLVILYLTEMRGVDAQREQNLLERATEASNRLAKNILPAAWEVFQEPASREFPQQLATDILNSELDIDFIVAIVVQGNFGHILLGRQKTPQGNRIAINSPSDLLNNYTGKVRTPMQQSAMTVGHIEVYYTNAFHMEQTQEIKRAGLLRVSMVMCLLQVSLYLFYRASRHKQQAMTALEELKGTQDKLIESEKVLETKGYSEKSVKAIMEEVLERKGLNAQL